MHPIIVLFLLVMYGCLLMFLVGNAWRLKAPSRKKALRGLSVQLQMRRYNEFGCAMMNLAGLFAAGVFVVFVIIAVFLPVEYVTRVPEKLVILPVTHQGKLIIAADGELKSIEVAGRDPNCARNPKVYFVDSSNLLEKVMYKELVVEFPDCEEN